MHNFKSVFISIVSILIFFILCSSIIMEPYLNSESQFYQDQHLRDSLSGSIDFIINGASNSSCAYDTNVIDSFLNTNSYNLSGILMSLNSRKYLLKKELKRNPVRTVVLDVSYETLIRDELTESIESDSCTYARCDSLMERLHFIFSCVPLDQWSRIYSKNFIPHSIEYFWGKLKEKSLCSGNVDYAAKGFWKRPSANVKLAEADAVDLHNQNQMNINFRSSNVEKLEMLINLCKAYDTRVILSTVPVPDSRIWKEEGQDKFNEYIRSIAQRNHCEYFDFNLLKKRYTLFDDSVSYRDGEHMSAEGAAVFTKAFCDIIKKAETEDISQYFYSSYEEMKVDSPYMQYLK